MDEHEILTIYNAAGARNHYTMRRKDDPSDPHLLPADYVAMDWLANPSDKLRNVICAAPCQDVGECADILVSILTLFECSVPTAFQEVHERRTAKRKGVT